MCGKYNSNTTLSSFPLNLMETSPFANKQEFTVNKIDFFLRRK